MKDNVFNPHIRDFDHYKELYKKSVDDPSKFFAELAQENLDWIEPFSNFIKYLLFVGILSIIVFILIRFFPLPKII